MTDMYVEQLLVDGLMIGGLVLAPDAFDYIYECISGNHGEDLREYVGALYNDTAIDHGLHPDDDFEDIINRILDDLGA